MIKKYIHCYSIGYSGVRIYMPYEHISTRVKTCWPLPSLSRLSPTREPARAILSLPHPYKLTCKVVDGNCSRYRYDSLSRLNQSLKQPRKLIDMEILGRTNGVGTNNGRDL